MNLLNLAGVIGVAFVLLYCFFTRRNPEASALSESMDAGFLDKALGFAIIPLILFMLFGVERLKPIAGIVLLLIGTASIFLQHRRRLANGLERAFVWKMTLVFMVGQAGVLAFVVGTLAKA